MRRPWDWFRQAELDLATARDAHSSGHHEWACFAAQQAAEKAVKALHEPPRPSTSTISPPVTRTPIRRAPRETSIPLQRRGELSATPNGSSNMSDVVFHRLDRDLILERLRGYTQRELAGRPEVREVVLIGSLARGDWSARSDADVVVVVDEAAEPGPFRGAAYAPSESVGVAVDVLVYTPGEAADWSARFRAEVEQGVVLYRRQE